MRKNKNKLKISIVIPVYNREKLISHCLDSIYKTTYSNFEVIVVDDGSTDHSVKVAKKFPCRIIRLKKNMGVSHARNTGVRNAKGQIVYLVDSDIIQKGDTISEIMLRFEKDPELDVLATSLSKRPFNKGFGPEFILLKYYYQTTYVINKKNLKMQEVTFLPTCSVAIKKEVFNETREFNPLFRLGGEEHELGHRISQKFKIYIATDIEVIPNLPSILKRGAIRLKRSMIFVELFVKRKRFEPIGSVTSKEALITPLVSMAALGILAGLVSPPILIISIILILTYVSLNSKFYYFLAKEKTILFMIQGIFADFFLYLTTGIGIFLGFLKLIISRVIK